MYNSTVKQLKMSLSDEEDDLPMPKKQRIYYGSLEDKVRDIASGGGGQIAKNGAGADYDNEDDEGGYGEEESDDENDAIAQAIKAGNINIADGKIIFEMR